MRACEQKLIVYARPREIIFMDRLPRTAVGKVDAGKLRQLAQENGDG